MNADQIKILCIDFGLVVIVASLTWGWNIPLKDLVRAPWRGRRVQNLAEWLEIATGKLVPSVQARVRAEIEAHYAEAVKSRQNAGLPTANAQAVALADLGEAHAAARRYNWEYLTKEEAGQLASYINDTDLNIPPPPILQRNRFLKFLNCNWGLVFLLCTSILTGLATRFDPDPEGFHGRHLVIVVFMQASLLLMWIPGKKLWQRTTELANQKISPDLLGRLVLLHSLVRLGWAAFFTSAFYIGTDSLNASDILFMLISATIAVRSSVSVIKFLRLRRKILYADVEELNLPPQRPTTA